MQSEIESIKAENEKLRNEIEKIHHEKPSLNDKEIVPPQQTNPISIGSEVEKLKKYILALKKPKLGFSIYDINEYTNEGKIGDGAQSNVYKVYKDDRKYYAKKEFNTQSFTHKDLQRFLQESEILFLLRHPCIIRVHGFNFGDTDNAPNMILSLEEGSLEDAIKNKTLTKEEKSQIAVEIVLGMRFVHGKNFIHRDLKPSNILLSKNKHVKISDFGLARDDSLKESMTKGIGTIRFMAPELLQDDDGELTYDKSVDVYAFGIILFFIVNNDYPPFNLIKVARGIMPKMPESMAKWVQDLINDCFRFNPEERPTFAKIFEIMKFHNFDLFGDETKAAPKKKTMANGIEARIAKIEAFEFQHKDD